MSTTTFLRGICVGMVAGAVVEMIANPRPQKRKTAVGKVMQRMGNAVDSAMDTVTDMMQ